MNALRIEARPFRPGDEHLLAAGLERVRSAAAAPPDLALLRWRYGSAPHGARLAVALDASERPIAGLCATRHRARLEGRDSFWLEVSELFNDFGAGRGLVRARGLLAAGRAFSETFGGFDPDRHALMYGMPTRRAHRVGLRHLEWEVLRSENELVLEPARAPGPPASLDVVVEPVPRFPEEVSRAFEAHAVGRAAILVRDAAYLNWRYAERPGAPFARAIARRAGEPVGYAVVRGGELHDWGAVPADEPTVRALLSWTIERARAAGAPELTAIIPDSAPEWLLFQRLGFRVRGTPHYLCFRSYQRPAIMSWLFQHWSYSRGDVLC